MIIGKWVDEYPSEVGMYWFYGCPEMGCMGWHYDPGYDIRKDLRMHLVSVKKTGDGKLLGVTDARFIYSRRFDRENNREGWFGRWSPADIPEPPAGLFLSGVCRQEETI